MILRTPFKKEPGQLARKPTVVVVLRLLASPLHGCRPESVPQRDGVRQSWTQPARKKSKSGGSFVPALTAQTRLAGRLRSSSTGASSTSVRSCRPERLANSSRRRKAWTPAGRESLFREARGVPDGRPRARPCVRGFPPRECVEPLGVGTGRSGTGADRPRPRGRGPNVVRSRPNQVGTCKTGLLTDSVACSTHFRQSNSEPRIQDRPAFCISGNDAATTTCDGVPPHAKSVTLT